MKAKLHLYFDDTGSRDPDKSSFSPRGERDDKMDCFALGGILVKEEDVTPLIVAYKSFRAEHNIHYPLHSWKIRGGRGDFGWLKNPEKAGFFMADLEEFLLSLPIICLACVVNRPGYLARYKGRYEEQLWLMCKTAFSIMIERAAKFADHQDRKLEVYFEQAGKKEDRDIRQYMRDLKTQGPPFSQQTSGGYCPMSAEDFRRIVLGKPERKTKNTPMIQIADLVLYPMAKSGSQPDYRPYAKLKDAGKLIDCALSAEEIPRQGVKYSCFDD